jgi:hypothetical protein
MATGPPACARCWRRREGCADVLLLAGDTFENNQLSPAILDRARCLLAAADLPVVILPGNHDPALADSVFVRGELNDLPNVSVLGVTHDEAVPFAAFDLEIWGHAHRDYFSMAPLRGPRRRSTRWQLAMAHGHYEPPQPAQTRCGRPGSLATKRSPRRSPQLTILAPFFRASAMYASPSSQ